jgi:predicted transcriptional regulator
MKLYEIKEILKATFLTGEAHKDKEVHGAGVADLMADVVAAAARDSVLLTALSTLDVIRMCKVVEVGCVVFVRGRKPAQSIIGLADLCDLPLLLTSYSLFESCGRLYANGLKGLNGSW